MTPPTVAKYMANRLLQGLHKKVIRVLEPAAGSGNLVAAVFDYIAAQPQKPQKVEFVLYEIDSSMMKPLLALAKHMRREAKKLGFSVSCSIRQNDFLLNIRDEKFDVVIANPPFFKLRKNDPRSIAHKHIVHGQPNIYGLFMAACAQLLADDGRYCFITPRSWTSGSYFSELRKYLFKYLYLEAVHLFKDREAVFTNDRVQQEMMITCATVKTSQDDVMVSSSSGIADLGNVTFTLVPIANVIANKKCRSVNLPLASSACSISNFQCTLETIGCRASTGKVVPFRATRWITSSASKNTVPLLWMRHVRRNEVVWPLKGDREHIVCSEKSIKLLVHNQNYVLVRRFSPRDQEHWIMAAPLIENTNKEYIGIENHVNYIHGVGVALTKYEVIGLAAYLNSRQVSLYFASRLGHTQINATDLNFLPVPCKEDLRRIGEKRQEGVVQSEIDSLIDSIIYRINPNTDESLRDEQRISEKSSI